MNKHQNLQDEEPLISAKTSLPEFTIKSIILSIILAIILAASNAYLALKIGSTVSASIPASVLALGILRFFKRHNILESNLVQTAASAGEAVAAAVAFILPAMIFLYIWKGFSYWETTLTALLGGLLGVCFAVPLRRVLLNLPGLRFPEGTAIGNVLKASTKGGSSLRLLIEGSLAGGIISLLQVGLKILSNSVNFWINIGRTVFGISIGFTPAVLAVGYIVGFEIAMSFFTGILVGWIILLPLIGIYYGIPHGKSAFNVAMGLWSNYLRYVGVGVMIVGGIWTLLRLLKPIARGLRVSFSSFRQGNPENNNLMLRTERDIPLHWVIIISLGLAVFCYALIFFYFEQIQLLFSAQYLWFIVLYSVFYILIIGFLVVTIASYFCGLVGSSNNPISGIVITVVLLLSFIYLFSFRVASTEEARYIASAVIIVATIVTTMGAIGGENIQDLKAGKMVGATPWRQQLMMAIGVIASALIIGPILELLFQAYGMGGVYPRPGMDPSQVLAAPQAGIMAAVAQGVLTHHLRWEMIILGGIVAAIIIVIDEILRRKNYRLPALAVGLGIYLPPIVTTPMVLGGVVSYLVKRQKRQTLTPEKEAAMHEKYHQGILLACGMVAGSALMGVILAIPFVLMGSSNALAVVSKSFVPIAGILGAIVFVGLCYWLYRLGRLR